LSVSVAPEVIDEPGCQLRNAATSEGPQTTVDQLADKSVSRDVFSAGQLRQFLEHLVWEAKRCRTNGWRRPRSDDLVKKLTMGDLEFVGNEIRDRRRSGDRTLHGLDLSTIARMLSKVSLTSRSASPPGCHSETPLPTTIES
jgi:hypothetical protein